MAERRPPLKVSRLGRIRQELFSLSRKFPEENINFETSQFQQGIYKGQHLRAESLLPHSFFKKEKKEKGKKDIYVKSLPCDTFVLM